MKYKVTCKLQTSNINGINQTTNTQGLNNWQNIKVAIPTTMQFQIRSDKHWLSWRYGNVEGEQG